MAPFQNLRKRMRLTWQQRAAGLAMALFVLTHSPTFSFQVEYSDNTIRTLKWSPLQTVAVGLIKTQPDMAPWTRYYLLPGTFFEQFVLTIDACYVNPSLSNPCDWSKLTDWKGLLERADISDKVDVFSEKMGEHRQFVQGSAAAATVFSFTCIVLDGAFGLVAAYAGLAYTTYLAGCEQISVTNMCAAMMIAVYIMMSGGDDTNPAPAPRTEAAKETKKLK
ncbi:hypothetical protein PLESTB_000528800 [Pleodorina starrii]|uniref:Uncharacterized protein n=1 Tax=Pleodorina starrii TaxID=330485 RepID=A0A9W6BH44_9CHLO|nr:hypothetical protein PLESTM_000392200 [Pleodorina starrii]GLC51683.1 hypothetical protein PLESTB_000528800 [Pleodorina starrii]